MVGDGQNSRTNHQPRFRAGSEAAYRAPALAPTTRTSAGAGAGDQAGRGLPFGHPADGQPIMRRLVPGLPDEGLVER